jgi:DinB superfamily
VGYARFAMNAVPELLLCETDEAYEILLRCIGDLTDEEYAWEPGPDAWRVFRGEDGRWTHDYAEPDPEPSPFTTIGWRVAHVATCKVMYHEWAFGPQRLTWLTIETPHDVEGALAMLREGHDLLRADLAALDEPGLNAEVLTNWGEPWPAWRIFWTMIHHDLQHGGEIGALRDYLRTSPGTR